MPLIVRVPGVEPAVVSTPVALVDIVPMLLELTGPVADLDASLFDGQSLLVPMLSPERAWPDRPVYCSVLSQTARQGNFMRRAVRIGDRALMQDMLEGNYELYDTRSDPPEANDIFRNSAEAETVERLKVLLESSVSGNLFAMQLTGE